jgi:hypothetical protein
MPMLAAAIKPNAVEELIKATAILNVDVRKLVIPDPI